MKKTFFFLSGLFVASFTQIQASSHGEPDFKNPDVLQNIIRHTHVEGPWVYHLPKFPTHTTFREGAPKITYEQIHDERSAFVHSLNDSTDMDARLMAFTGNLQLAKEIYVSLIETSKGALHIAQDAKGYLVRLPVAQAFQDHLDADQVSTRVLRSARGSVPHAATTLTYLMREYYKMEAPDEDILRELSAFEPSMATFMMRLMGLEASEEGLRPLPLEKTYLMDESRTENIAPMIVRTIEAYVAEEGLEPHDKRVLVVARGRLGLIPGWFSSDALAYSHMPYTLDVNPCQFPDAVWSIVDPALRSAMPAHAFDEIFFDGLTYAELWRNPEIAKNAAHLLKPGGLMYKNGAEPSMEIFGPAGFEKITWDGEVRTLEQRYDFATRTSVNGSAYLHYLRLR